MLTAGRANTYRRAAIRGGRALERTASKTQPVLQNSTNNPWCTHMQKDQPAAKQQARQRGLTQSESWLQRKTNHHSITGAPNVSKCHATERASPAAEFGRMAPCRITPAWASNQRADKQRRHSLHQAFNRVSCSWLLFQGLGPSTTCYLCTLFIWTRLILVSIHKASDKTWCIHKWQSSNRERPQH